MTEEDLRVRQLAYRIWESEGRPSGQEQRHWDMALKIVNAERASGNMTPVDELPLQEHLGQEEAPMEDRGASDYGRPEAPTSPAQAQPEGDQEPEPDQVPHGFQPEPEPAEKPKRKPRAKAGTAASKNAEPGAGTSKTGTRKTAKSKESTAKAATTRAKSPAKPRKPKGSAE